MSRRPGWVDRLFVILWAMGMIWVAFDMFSHHGVIPGMLYPATFGIVPLVIVFALRLPLEVCVLLLVWVGGFLGLYSGIVDGVTFFPSKRADLSLKFSESPIAFTVAMCAHAAVTICGGYFAYKAWDTVRAR